MKKLFIFLAVAFLFLTTGSVNAAIFDVSNATEFQTRLIEAAQNGQDDTINVAAGIYNISNQLLYSTWENYALTIQGAGAGVTILHGGDAYQILSLDTNNLSGGDNNAHITIKGLTFTNGATTAMPGGGLSIFTENANITLENCAFTNNIAGYGGGADLETNTGTITLTNNVFNNNSSDYDGAGVYITSRRAVSLTNNTFTENHAQQPDNGGGEQTFMERR